MKNVQKQFQGSSITPADLRSVEIFQDFMMKPDYIKGVRSLQFITKALPDMKLSLLNSRTRLFVVRYVYFSHDEKLQQ